MSEENDKSLVVTTPTNGTSLFKGPLGLWPWPVVNLVLAIVNRLGRRGGTGTRATRTKITELRPNSSGGWSILEHEV